MFRLKRGFTTDIKWKKLIGYFLCKGAAAIANRIPVTEEAMCLEHDDTAPVTGQLRNNNNVAVVCLSICSNLSLTLKATYPKKKTLKSPEELSIK